MRFLKLALFVWILCSIAVAADCSFEALRKNKAVIKGTLHKVSKHIYRGEARLSGVLMWRRDFIQDSEGWGFRELVFYPDKCPLFDDEYMYFTLYRDDKLATLFPYPARQIANQLQVFLGKEWEAKYALSDMAVRVELTIFNHRHIDTDFIEGGIDFVEFKDMALMGDVQQCFFQTDTMLSLSYASKDPFINLRQSPNGKILKKITQDEMRRYESSYDADYGDICALVETTKNRGMLVMLGKDPTNPKWLKVAYIPADSKDTSKAIYGVVHESQVSPACEE